MQFHSQHFTLSIILFRFAGLRLAISGNVPQGFGLSSSAAIEVATATALNELAHAALTPQQLAVVAQQAEHNYAGVMCGIMDQFVFSSLFSSLLSVSLFLFFFFLFISVIIEIAFFSIYIIFASVTFIIIYNKRTFKRPFNLLISI